MRAVLCRELGGFDRLVVDRMEQREPGEGEVRIRVTAAGLNFADLLMVRGRYQEKPELPFVPGMEIAGEIDRLGPNVVGLEPGQRVMATLGHGGFAEMAIVRAGEIVPLPDAIDDVTAAGFAIAYGTAFGALEWAGRLKPDETLVVHGSAGGVGLATVECGKAFGARVIGTARGKDRLTIVKAHGADHVIDTESDDLRGQIKALTDQRGADVVFDPIGGKIFDASLRSLAWEGRLLVIGFAGGDIQQIPANLLLVKNVSAVGFYWGSYRRKDPKRVQDCFETLLDWYVKGLIKPHVSLVRPLDQFKEAFEALDQRKSTGKVVLTMNN